MFGRGKDHTQDLQPVQLEELERHQRVADRPESVCRNKKNASLERSCQVQRTSLPGERAEAASGAFDQRDVGAGGVLTDAANEIFEVDLPAFAINRFRWGHGIAKSKQRVLGLCLTRRASQQGPVFRLRWEPWTSSLGGFTATTRRILRRSARARAQPVHVLPTPVSVPTMSSIEGAGTRAPFTVPPAVQACTVERTGGCEGQQTPHQTRCRCCRR